MWEAFVPLIVLSTTNNFHFGMVGAYQIVRNGQLLNGLAYNYQTQTPSVYTKEKMHAYKSLDAFSYVVTTRTKYFDAAPEYLRR